jgi:hypothetical protein
MNVLRLSLIAFIVILTLPVNAKVLTDPQTSSQITVPDSWKTFIAPPGYSELSARAYDAALYPAIDFSVDEETTLEQMTDDSEFVKDFIKNVESQGSVITNRGQRKLNDRNFLVLSLTTKTSSGHTNFMTAWFTAVKGHACQICLSARESGPDKNDTLNGVIQSFSSPK